jgi:hypothetical protein
VLLANLCESPELREHIRTSLPNQRLDTLVNAVEEFIKVNMMVDQEKTEGEEGEQAMTAFTERLQTVLDRLRLSATR